MHLIRTQPITGPAAWRGPDFANDSGRIHHLSPDHIALLDTALAQLKARSLHTLECG